jgi:hypothetical protein
MSLPYYRVVDYFGFLRRVGDISVPQTFEGYYSTYFSFEGKHTAGKNIQVSYDGGNTFMQYEPLAEKGNRHQLMALDYFIKSKKENAIIVAPHEHGGDFKVKFTRISDTKYYYLTSNNKFVLFKFV